jgi:hypothetical protein
MPSKGRIEEETFQRALHTLATDQLCLLDSSSATSVIWGSLCISMHKADNLENRRACYDVWRRKRVKFQPVVDELLQRNTIQSAIHQIDSSLVSADNVKEMASTNITTKRIDSSEISELNNKTSVNIPINVCKIIISNN